MWIENFTKCWAVIGKLFVLCADGSLFPLFLSFSSCMASSDILPCLYSACFVHSVAARYMPALRSGRQLVQKWSLSRTWVAHPSGTAATRVAQVVKCLKVSEDHAPLNTGNTGHLNFKLPIRETWHWGRHWLTDWFRVDSDALVIHDSLN